MNKLLNVVEMYLELKRIKVKYFYIMKTGVFFSSGEAMAVHVKVI